MNYDYLPYSANCKVGFTLNHERTRHIGLIFVIENILLVLLLSASLANAQSAKWFSLNFGKSAHSFSFKDDGTLLYSGKAFNYRIVVPDDNNKSFIPTEIWISSTNPSGQYAILEARNRYQDFGYCWLLDLRHLTVTDINHTHYGPARWVAWSPDGRYAILDDPEAQVLQRVKLSTGQVDDLQVTGYWGGMEGITPDNTRTAVEAKEEYEDIALQSFYWITGTLKFVVRVDVKKNDYKAEIDHSFFVEVDVKSGRSRQLK